ncbi:MAG: SDR family oxidoreductase [Ktedonobacteraceae bacterium]|nr:SDR family oxidoreductase [Ktedonobacteraceae bacterium]
MTHLSGKVALITGAGSGIGKATAVLLAQHGARVVALAHTADEVEQTVKEITQAGNEAIPAIADISKENEIKSAIQQAVGRWGHLDIVFANAGINGTWAPIDELALEEWNRTITTNLTGTFLTIKHTVPFLKRQGGSIVITASVNGTRVFSNSGATAYSATKAAQVAMTKMLAVELAQNNIRVNVVCPGATETEISDNTQARNVEHIKFPVEFPKGSIPLGGKPATAEDVAELVMFLSSDAARNITGTEVWIDGASSLVKG